MLGCVWTWFFSVSFMFFCLFSFLFGFFFFFFQAEDGIRDHCVTGVQTCALPISFRFWLPASPGPARPSGVELGPPRGPGANPVDAVDPVDLRMIEAPRKETLEESPTPPGPASGPK